MHRRPWVAPTTFYYRNNGVLLRSDAGEKIVGQYGGGGRLCAQFTSARVEQGAFFGWPDTAADDARKLAAKLLERLPDLAEAGTGWDHAYAGWFLRLVGLAERGWLPEEFSDSHGAGADAIALIDVRPSEWRICEQDQAPTLPFPPPAELAEDYEGLVSGAGRRGV